MLTAHLQIQDVRGLVAMWMEIGSRSGKHSKFVELGRWVNKLGVSNVDIGAILERQGEHHSPST